MSFSLNKINEAYFSRLFNESKGSESKARALLLDDKTTCIVSLIYTQTQLLLADVILVEQVRNCNSLGNMLHLDCIVYISPSKSSLDFLFREIKSPHFDHYLVFFNNSLSKKNLQQLAEADSLAIVNSVVELYQDFFSINDTMFSVNSTATNSRTKMIEQSHSLSSLLLALRKCPIIRYDSTSLKLKRLALELLYNINSNSNNNLFDDVNNQLDRPPLLLLIDRDHDPITPLLTPWTYQSMIHEFIGIQKNIVQISESEESVVLSDIEDTFWRESMYLNYGDLTEKFQKYVEVYKTKTRQSSLEGLKTQDLAELKMTLIKFPEYKKLSANVFKHLNLIGDLDKQIAAQNLWELGELQQSIVCNTELQTILKTRMLEILDKSNVSTINKFVLALLYSLKFPNTGELLLFAAKLNDLSLTLPVISPTQNKLLRNAGTIFPWAHKVSNKGTDIQLSSLFDRQSFSINKLFNLNTAAGTISKPKTDNVYMQHVPLLGEIMDQIAHASSHKPEESQVPNLHSVLIPDIVVTQFGKNCAKDPVQDVIVYFEGGVTFEEVRILYDFNASNPEMRFVIGGDIILNSETWLNHLYDRINDQDVPTQPTTEDFAAKRHS